MQNSFADYFNIPVIKNYDINKNNTMICCHPHGIISAGFWNLFTDKRLKKFKLCAHDNLLNTPLAGDLFRHLNIISCDKNTMEYEMNTGSNLFIIPGGYREVYNCKPDEDKYYLSKGLIELCLRFGYRVIPTYTFGENNLFDILRPPFDRLTAEKVAKKLGAPIMIPHGRAGLLIPKKIPLLTVMAEPLDFEHIYDPSPDDIDYYFELYCASLEKLFYDNIDEYIKVNPDYGSREISFCQKK